MVNGMRKLIVPVFLAVLVLPFYPPVLAGKGCVDELPVLGTLASKDVPITMRFEGVPLGNILDALRRAAEFKIEGEEDLEAPASVVADHTPLQQVLAILATRYGLRYEVPEPGTLVVRSAPEDAKEEKKLSL